MNIVRIVSRQLWLTIVVGLVMLALYSSLGRQLMPLVENYSQELEDFLAESIGQPVNIGSLQGSWTGISPVITVQDISIGGEEGLYFSLAEVELDIGASAFYRQPVFNQIRLDGASATIKQVSDFEWQLAPGWVVVTDESEKNTSSDFKKITRWLERQENIQLSSLFLQLSRLGHATEQYRIERARWRSLGNQHELLALLSLGQGALSNIRLQAYLEGDLWPLQAHNGHVYFEVEEQDWSKWLSFSDETSFKINEFKGAAKGWLEISKGNLHRLYFDVDIPVLKIHKEQHPFSLTEGKITFTGEHSDNDWHMKVKPTFKEELPFNQFHLSQINLPGQRVWQLGLGSLDIGAAQVLLEKYQILPERVADFIDGTKPTGNADNIRVSFFKDTKTDEVKFDLRADILDLHSIAYHGIPSFEGVNAKLQIQKLAGLVELEDADLNFKLDNLYSKKWRISHVNTNFRWLVFAEHAQLLLDDTFASLHEENSQTAWPVNANMSIILPIKKNEIEPNISLLVALPEGPLSLQQQLVPDMLGENVQHWLNDSLSVGRVSSAAFALQTSLAQARSENSSSAQLYLEIEEAALDYLEGWPQVTNINGSFFLNSPDIEVKIESARTLGGALKPSSSQAKLFPYKAGMMLEVSAGVRGSSSEALRYFKETPLAELMNHAFDSWQVQGAHETDILLRVALANEIDEPEIWISSHLDKNQLVLQDINLTIDQLAGKINYSSFTGINSKQLSGQALGGLFTSELTSEVRKNGQMNVTLLGSGQAYWQNIQQWQPLFFLQPIAGELDYRAKIDVINGRTRIHFDSELENTEINLPAPFAKYKGEKNPFQLTMHVDKKLYMEANYQDNLKAAMLLSEVGVERGQVVLGGESARLPNEKTLTISGKLAGVTNAEEWWETWLRVNEASQTASKDSIYPSVELDFEQIDVWGVLLGQASLSAKYDEQWQVAIHSPVVAGKAWLSLEDEPLVAKLDYLRFEGTNEEEKDEDATEQSAELDPWRTIIPQDFFALNLEVGDIAIGEQSFGFWKLEARPTEQGLSIQVLDSDLFELATTGQLEWQYIDNQHMTYLRGLELVGRDVQQLQKGFNLPVFIEGERLTAEADLSWLGSPAFFRLNNLVGHINLELKDGRLITESGAALKAIGALNIGSLSRRLKLDFSDLYKSGLAFDKLEAGLNFVDQYMEFDESMRIEGPGGKFVATGKTYLPERELDMRVAVILPVSNNLPLVAILAGLSPPVAASIYVTEKLVGNELSRFTTANYELKGSWEEPEMRLRTLFNKDQGKPSFGQRLKGIFSRN